MSAEAIGVLSTAARRWPAAPPLRFPLAPDPARRQAGIAGPPVAAAGLLLVLRRDGVLAALDAATGSARWQCPLPATADRLPPYSGAPLVAGDHVFIRSGAERLVVSVQTGAVLDRRPALPLDLVNGLLTDGLLVSAFEDRLGAWEPHAMQPRWSRVHRFTPVPLAASGGLLLAAEDDTVLAIESASGELRWKHALTQDEPGIGGLYFATDRVVVVAANQAVLGLDAASGDLLWRAPAPFPATGTLAVTDDGEIHLLGWPAYLRLSATDGRILLDAALDPATLPRARASLGRASTDGAHVIACDARGPIVAVSRETGAVAWTFAEKRHRRLADHAVAAGTRLYVLDADGNLDCFQATT